MNEALAIAREIQDKGHQAWVLARIAPNLEEAQKTQVMNEALALVKKNTGYKYSFQGSSRNCCQFSGWPKGRGPK